MRFYIGTGAEKLLVIFPYDSIYPEQQDYMTSLKEALDAGRRQDGKGHCLENNLILLYWKISFI